MTNVASAAADVASAIETPDKAAAESTYKDTVERLGKALLGKIASARVTGRLTDSPAVLVAGEFGVSLRMGRILKQAGQNNPFATLPILELNPKHALVERLKDTADEAAFCGSGACAVRSGHARRRRRARGSGHLRAARQQAHRRGARGRAENHPELTMLTPRWAAWDDADADAPATTTRCSMPIPAR